MNIISKLIYYLKAIPQYLFLREQKYRRKSKELFNKYYSTEFPRADSSRKTIIFMADKKFNSGGLADRLRGIVSLFDYCLKHDIDFKIKFSEPFELTDFLIPNEYDWTITDNNISYNSNDSYPVFFIPHKEKVLNLQIEIIYQKFILNRLIRHKQPQIHVYTNALFAEMNFGELFNRLFKPSIKLGSRLEREKKSLGNQYISVSTRFLELLGDFEEPEKMRETLSECEQTKLINSCIKQIELIKAKWLKPGNKIFVTSDSTKFLNVIKNLNFCYVADGEISHLENTKALGNSNIKTFIDFLLISQASRVFLLVGPGMYTSNFSKRASQINSVPFEQIEF